MAPSHPTTTRTGSCSHLWSDQAHVSTLRKSLSALALTHLAPQVPTRLFALKHGAKLVWGPETIDKAILHTTRVVDRESMPGLHLSLVPDCRVAVTGVVSYHGKSKAIFTTHPIEKPFLIYQIGSADPELAVQAAKMVQQDVSGFDLNCGCPKPFSTLGGMGAALLTNPDLLCSILSALRAAMPPEITISAKIRLLPSQEDTLKLVERIVNTGVSALTVHCRTRNMRMNEKAKIERLREIVEFVEGLGKGTAVIENGDCLGYEDSKRVREVTGASCTHCTTAGLALTSRAPYLRSAFCDDRDRGRVESNLLLSNTIERPGPYVRSFIYPTGMSDLATAQPALTAMIVQVPGQSLVIYEVLYLAVQGQAREHLANGAERAPGRDRPRKELRRHGESRRSMDR